MIEALDSDRFQMSHRSTSGSPPRGELSDEKGSDPDFQVEAQIRKFGERRYGKGEIRVDDDVVTLAYKKLLGKKVEASFRVSEVEMVEFRSKGLPFEIVGPGAPIYQDWITLEIALRGGGGFTIYVGQPAAMNPEKQWVYMEKFYTLYEILDSDPSPHAFKPPRAPLATDGDAEFELRCPMCGAVEHKSWICWECQDEEQPFYVGGRINHNCTKCGMDKRKLVPDPELLCGSCMQYSVASEWTPA
ncbi:hypothetical protein E2P65_05820 [Candidatus Bathyarchaeota archaeon]|nr:hypothetical protein E2P65_05820 [Candidatus Bathyarchaeota archaeon]